MASFKTSIVATLLVLVGLVVIWGGSTHSAAGHQAQLLQKDLKIDSLRARLRLLERSENAPSDSAGKVHLRMKALGTVLHCIVRKELRGGRTLPAQVLLLGDRSDERARVGNERGVPMFVEATQQREALMYAKLAAWLGAVGAADFEGGDEGDSSSRVFVLPIEPALVTISLGH